METNKTEQKGKNKDNVNCKTPQGIETNPYIMGTTSTFILLPLRKILFSISKLNRRNRKALIPSAVKNQVKSIPVWPFFIKESHPNH